MGRTDSWERPKRASPKAGNPEQQAARSFEDQRNQLSILSLSVLLFTPSLHGLCNYAASARERLKFGQLDNKDQSFLSCSVSLPARSHPCVSPFSSPLLFYRLSCAAILRPVWPQNTEKFLLLTHIFCFPLILYDVRMTFYSSQQVSGYLPTDFIWGPAASSVSLILLFSPHLVAPISFS